MEKEMPLQDKCEHLMNVVVESRKRFGKMCVDYEQKTSLMENNILNLHIKTIENHRFKPRHVVEKANYNEMIKDSDDFKDEIVNRQKRIENLKDRVKNVQQVVLHLKSDRIGQRLQKPIAVDAMLDDVRNKK